MEPDKAELQKKLGETQKALQHWQLQKCIRDVSDAIEPLVAADRLRVMRAVAVLYDVPMEEKTSPQQFDSYEQKTGH